jgi:PAS domain S-box-containing protein
MLGYEPEEIEPNVASWEKLVHPDDMPEIEEILNKHLNGETEYYESVHRVKTRDGSWKWILDHGMVVQRNKENKPVRTIGTHIDITRQKETEQQLQELIVTRDKLFSIIAHDLRGPIGNFLPILDLLTGSKDIDEETKKIFIEELKKAARSTFSLLENLLSWSRSQANAILLKSALFVINNTIRDNIDLLLSSAKNKSITISQKISEELSIYADPDTVNLVIRNLLTNAIKFTPDNGTITVSAHDNGRQIEVEIADTGVGMTKEVVDILFTSKTFRTTRGTHDEKGSGLGLILCKDFVERNGGEIHVESVVGEGSRFIFTLPKNK